MKLGFVSAILPDLNLEQVRETTYRGPVCIEVEDNSFGSTLEGRQRALKVARNVLKPFFA